jgi:hypothetical protein
MTEGMTVTSLPASLVQKISATMDSLCHIALSRKLLFKFEKWCKFSSRVEAKSHKTKSRKMRTTCNWNWCLEAQRTRGAKVALVFLINNLQTQTNSTNWHELDILLPTCKPLICWYLYTNPHGIISQKTVIFIMLHTVLPMNI